VIAAILYTFIAYGSFAIVNRTVVEGSGEVVEDYFLVTDWKAMLLRGIFLVNIVTVFP
jgi:hypothetical protein